MIAFQEHIVPNPVFSKRTVFTPKCNSPLSLHTRYDDGGRRVGRTLGDTPGTVTTTTYGRADNLPTAIVYGAVSRTLDARLLAPSAKRGAVEL